MHNVHKIFSITIGARHDGDSGNARSARIATDGEYAAIDVGLNSAACLIKGRIEIERRGSTIREEDEEIIALMSEFTHPKLDQILSDVQAGRLGVEAALEAVKAACATDPAFDRAMVARVIVDIFRKPEIGNEGQCYTDSELLARLAVITKQKGER